MGLHNDIATQIAAHTVGVAGIVSCSTTPLDSISGTPCGVVGPPKGTKPQPGSYEHLVLQYPLRIFVAARIDNAQVDQVAVNDFLDLFLTGFRANITLGGLVTEMLIRSWDTNRFYTVGLT